ncbi:MAG: hypothetical protein IIA67_13415 [Planctomycetes bacterium]|nr:hypothetical protein [Planctomycetota bacterium]
MIALIAHDEKKASLLEFVERHIFFRDPLTAQPHEPDVSALLRVCDVHNIPLATNPVTAEAVVKLLVDGAR